MEALLKFLVLLKKILGGQNLRMVPQHYDMRNDLLEIEALWVFERNPDKKAMELILTKVGYSGSDNPLLSSKGTINTYVRDF